MCCLFFEKKQKKTKYVVIECFYKNMYNLLTA